MTDAGLNIDYFYAPISAYSYLGEPRLIQIARQAGVTVRFKPIDIMPVFEAAGVTPPAKQSQLKLVYRRTDTARIAERLGLPLNPAPAHWPVPMALAAKIVIAAGLLGVDQHQVSMAIMTGIQAQDQDISSPEALLSILSNSQLPAFDLLDSAQGDDATQILQSNILQAIDQNVMGAPTYIIDSEMFFGQDRLVDLQWRLSQSQ